MFTATVDTSGFNRALRAFQKESRKSMDEVLEKEAGILVGMMIGKTPPADIGGGGTNKSGGVSSGAKKAGEKRLAADIATLFPTTRMKSEAVHRQIELGFEFGTGRGRKKVKDFAESISDLKRIHAFARSRSTGRVRTGTTGQNMAVTRKALLNQYIRQEKKRVGMLSAGWLRAARRLKTAKSKTPAWITRHGSKPGDVSFRSSKSGLTIDIANRMPYFPKNQARRVGYVLKRREHALEKALESMIARKAAKANQRMKR